MPQLFSFKSDPRVEGMPFFDSDLYPLVIVVAYLFFVLDVGRSMMSKRPAFQLRKTILVYNFLQVLLNAALFGTLVSYWKHTEFRCMTVLGPEHPFGHFEQRCTLFYTMIKMTDLADTVFFVLRKKYNQISFLHLYHHASLFLLSWYNGKYYAGGPSYHFMLANTFGHVLMYIYYMVTIYNPKSPLIMVKKYLTITQIGTHVYIMVGAGAQLFNPHCTYNNTFSVLMIGWGISIISLFLHFYRVNYQKIKCTPQHIH